MKNLKFGELDKLASLLIDVREHKFLNSPLIFSSHYPKIVH